MRRFIPLATAIASIAGVITLSSSVANAAPGDVTTTNVAVPAALQGLTVASVTSARDGGMYFAYTSGDDYKMFKTKPDGTQDTTFGANGIATIVGFTGAKRLSLTSDVNGKWWGAMHPNNGNTTARFFGGGPTGDTANNWTITPSTFEPYCASTYPTISAASWTAQNFRILPRRTSGFWVQYTCTAFSGSSQILTEGMWTLTAFTNTGVRDSAVASVGASNALSSTGVCFLNNFIVDPAAPASAPEIYLARTEHTSKLNGICQMNTSTITAAQITGYSIVSVASSGSTTTKLIASNGDATDGSIAGRVDPGGRLVLFNTNLANTSTMSVRRVKTDGTLDTTVGTNGVLTLSIGAAPAGQAYVSAGAVGLITTPTKVYFAVQLNDRTAAINMCNSTTPFTWGWRTVIVSPADGILTSYGTAGVGTRTFITAPENTVCTSNISGGASVDTLGQSRNVRFENGVAKFDVWAAPTGANGGGEGGTGSGGATTDTGGAPSKGNGSSSAATGTTDTTVYAKLPATVGINSAIQVLTAAQGKTQVLKSRTPKVCLTLTTSIVTTAKGTCVVRVSNKSDKALLRTLTTKVTATTTGIGTALTATDPLRFAIVSWTVNATAKAQLEKLAEQAKSASRVLIVGHSGMLYDTEAFNVNISLRRAAAVKAALQKAGVKSAINVVGLGSQVPLTTTKTESAQAKNRRVVLYFYP